MKRAVLQPAAASFKVSSGLCSCNFDVWLLQVLSSASVQPDGAASAARVVKEVVAVELLGCSNSTAQPHAVSASSPAPAPKQTSPTPAQKQLQASPQTGEMHSIWGVTIAHHATATHVQPLSSVLYV
jgi:hypothetical protein